MPRSPDSGAPPLPGGQSGFSLIEIVIAMFVLALMVLALFPLLVGAMRASAVNNDIVEATSLANSLLTDARREGASGCSALTAWAGRPDLAPAGSSMTVKASAGACPAALPATVFVNVVIHPAGDDSRTLIELSTKVMVE